MKNGMFKRFNGNRREKRRINQLLAQPDSRLWYSIILISPALSLHIHPGAAPPVVMRLRIGSIRPQKATHTTT